MPKNYFRLIGLPESVPTSDLHGICENDLPTLLGLSRRCKVERAHRIGPTSPHHLTSEAALNRPPRQVIMKYLDYNDKADILRTTRLEIKGAKGLMFEDCRKIRFQLLYPATIRIVTM